MTEPGSAICTSSSACLARSSASDLEEAAHREDLGDLFADANRRIQRCARFWYTIETCVRAQTQQLGPGQREDVAVVDQDLSAANAAVAREYCTIASAAVDFPQPDSPTSPYASPRPTESVTPRSTWRSRPPHAVDDIEVAQLECVCRLDCNGCLERLAHRSSTC